MNNNPYVQSSDPPKMRESFVCYVDILGYAQLSAEAIRSGQGASFLIRLRQALSNAYERVREHSKFQRKESFFAVKIFTDNIVIGYPLSMGFGYGEPELAHIFEIFSEFQVGLALEGFFVRGGISYGLHYMDDDIVFGDAFLEAVELDKHGGPPRIALASSAVELVRKHMEFYGQVQYSPQYDDLFEDADGTIFLNYLDEAFFAFPDGGVFLELIEGHQRAVIEGLKTYKGRPDVRAKFEWTARYHNFFCHDFAKRHPIAQGEDPDPVSALASEEAQKLLNYLINVESLAAEPKRIPLEQIRPQSDSPEEGIGKKEK